MGGKITIKIYDLARYIASDDEVASATAPKSVVRQQPKEKSHRGFSLGKSLMAFSRTIERQALDSSTKSTTGQKHKAMATVGEINRSTNSKRKS